MSTAVIMQSDLGVTDPLFKYITLAYLKIALIFLLELIRLYPHKYFREGRM